MNAPVNAVLTDEALRNPTATPATGRPKPSRRALIALGVAVVVALGGVGYILAAKPTAGTDDAYVQADKTLVAPKVRGLVAEVYVRDNQLVQAGQPLLRLDPEEYDARVAAASADLQAAQASVEAAQAVLASHAAEVR